VTFCIILVIFDRIPVILCFHFHLDDFAGLSLSFIHCESSFVNFLLSLSLFLFTLSHIFLVVCFYGNLHSITCGNLFLLYLFYYVLHFVILSLSGKCYISGIRQGAPWPEPGWRLH